MNNKLFVGSLPWALRGKELRELFEAFGEITEATVILDRDTGRSKGFGFVTFETVEDAAKAQEELNGKEVEGRAITVSFAQEKERTERRPFQARR